MYRFTLTVPANYNDGSTVPLDIIERIELELMDIAGGFTSTSGFGAWRSPAGTLTREPVTVYAVDSSRREDWLEVVRVGQHVADWLEQEAVYVTTSEIDAGLTGVPTLG